jgi:hypothetical protein
VYRTEPLKRDLGLLLALDSERWTSHDENNQLLAHNSTVAVSVDGGRNWRLSILGNEKLLPLRYPLRVAALTILDFRGLETVLLLLLEIERIILEMVL